MKPRVSSGLGAPLQMPDFRALWGANIISNAGTLMQAVGAAWLMIEACELHFHAAVDFFLPKAGWRLISLASL